MAYERQNTSGHNDPRFRQASFAQLERETIQKRVTDAYYSRRLKGFHMSGQALYGYQLEPTVVEGIRTKKMVADTVAADHVRLMFEMYAEPETFLPAP